MPGRPDAVEAQASHPAEIGWHDAMPISGSNHMVADWMEKSLKDAGNVVMRSRAESPDEEGHLWYLTKEEFDLLYPQTGDSLES